MTGFIQQLRKRGVLRAAGLYIALIWLVLQIADVVFPAFEIPDSVVRYILFVGIGGFPVALLCAWFFEFTDQGIQREAELEETGARRLQGRNYMWGATFFALIMALGISVFFNVQQVVGPTVAPDNVSILIADVQNQTGNPIFDGSLEQSLSIGLEDASFINSFSRQVALGIADKMSQGKGLSKERARLVATREGISLVFAGSIDADKEKGFLLQLEALDARDGTVVAAAQAGAGNQLGVLQAVGELAIQIREALGDINLRTEGVNANETFSTGSLQAIRLYSQAQDLSHLGRDKEAIELYRQAVAEDPGFGRAYSGWALSEYNLGNITESEKLWAKTLSLLGSMTERERYRTLGIYYTLASRNYDKAIENYELLINRFPADAVGRNNLAVTYFFNMQFDKALEQGRSILDIYPSNPVFRSNYALYAMYAGDFTTARKEAEALLELDGEYYKAQLPLAISKLAEGDTEGAKKAYQAMENVNPRAGSLASSGLIDLYLYLGDFEAAITQARQGIERDVESGNNRGQSDKLIALAQAEAALGNREAALAALAHAITISTELAHVVPAAQLFVSLGELDSARGLQLQLEEKLQPEFRAAAGLIEGNILLAKGETVAAVDAMRASRDKLDSWLIHFDLGRAYFAAGFFAEALSEFELCKTRIGEATSVYLDDIPSFRYSAPLTDWLQKTRQQLGMSAEDSAG